MNEKNNQGGIGENGVMLYELSTCGWCRKTKTLLGELGVSFNHVDVDLISGAERERIMDEVKRWNPDCTFPTLVIGNQKCIVGYQEAKIKEALGK